MIKISEKIIAGVLVLYFFLSCFLFNIFISNVDKRLVKFASDYVYCVIQSVNYSSKVVNSLLKLDIDALKYETCELFLNNCMIVYDIYYMVAK